MVDAENLRLVEDAARDLVDGLCGGHVTSDRFFHDDACVWRSSPRSSCQPGTGQSLADIGEGAGGNAEIENAIPGQLESPLEFFGSLLQSHIGLSVVVSSCHIK